MHMARPLVRCAACYRGRDTINSSRMSLRFTSNVTTGYSSRVCICHSEWRYSHSGIHLHQDRQHWIEHLYASSLRLPNIKLLQSKVEEPDAVVIIASIYNSTYICTVALMMVG